MQELAEQALNEYSATYNNEAKIPEAYLKKFAELIVEECIAQCWTVSELESNGYVISECSKKIRKHFGVEE
jgi:hypothetical protein